MGGVDFEVLKIFHRFGDVKFGFRTVGVRFWTKEVERSSKCTPGINVSALNILVRYKNGEGRGSVGMVTTK